MTYSVCVLQGLCQTLVACLGITSNVGTYTLKQFYSHKSPGATRVNCCPRFCTGVGYPWFKQGVKNKSIQLHKSCAVLSLFYFSLLRMMITNFTSRICGSPNTCTCWTNTSGLADVMVSFLIQRLYLASPSNGPVKCKLDIFQSMTNSRGSGYQKIVQSTKPHA